MKGNNNEYNFLKHFVIICLTILEQHSIKYYVIQVLRRRNALKVLIDKIYQHNSI